MEGKQLTLFNFAESDRQEHERARSRAETTADYEAFTEKFKPKKTTDDCYTPEAVYAAVLDFVRTLPGTAGREIVRPFWPGADYQQFPYPERCIVVDNPPFSIYAQIVRWYLSRGIDFFLFSPSLTTFVRGADVTYFITNASITYENGAVVNTSFVSNLVPGVRIWLSPDLRAASTPAPRPPKIVPKNTYPDTVVTSAILGKIIDRGVELKIRTEECQWIRNLDSLSRAGKSLWGGGLHHFRTGSSRTSSSRTGGSRTGSRYDHHPVAGRAGHRGTAFQRRNEMKFAFVNTFSDLCLREHILTSGDRPFFYRKPSPLASRLDRLLTALRSMCSQRRGAFFYFLLCEHRTKPASHCQRILRTISPHLSCPPSPTFKSPGTGCKTRKTTGSATCPRSSGRVSQGRSSTASWTSTTSMTNSASCCSISSPARRRACPTSKTSCYDHR